MKTRIERYGGFRIDITVRVYGGGWRASILLSRDFGDRLWMTRLYSVHVAATEELAFQLGLGCGSAIDREFVLKLRAP